MSAFIVNQLNQIIKDPRYPYPQNLAMGMAWIMGHFRGEGLKVLNVGENSSMADYFVISTAQSSTQLSSMVHAMKKYLRELNFKVHHAEGENSGWALVDFGDVVAHVFLEVERELYDLEGLWADCPRVEIPQDYYFSHSENQQDSGGSSSGTGDYF